MQFKIAVIGAIAASVAVAAPVDSNTNGNAKRVPCGSRSGYAAGGSGDNTAVIVTGPVVDSSPYGGDDEETGTSTSTGGSAEASGSGTGSGTATSSGEDSSASASGSGNGSGSASAHSGGDGGEDEGGDDEGGDDDGDDGDNDDGDDAADNTATASGEGSGSGSASVTGDGSASASGEGSGSASASTGDDGNDDNEGGDDDGGDDDGGDDDGGDDDGDDGDNGEGADAADNSASASGEGSGSGTASVTGDGSASASGSGSGSGNATTTGGNNNNGGDDTGDNGGNGVSPVDEDDVCAPNGNVAACCIPGDVSEGLVCSMATGNITTLAQLDAICADISTDTLASCCSSVVTGIGSDCIAEDADATDEAPTGDDGGDDTGDGGATTTNEDDVCAPDGTVAACCVAGDVAAGLVCQTATGSILTVADLDAICTADGGDTLASCCTDVTDGTGTGCVAQDAGADLDTGADDGGDDGGDTTTNEDLVCTPNGTVAACCVPGDVAAGIVCENATGDIATVGDLDTICAALDPDTESSCCTDVTDGIGTGCVAQDAGEDLDTGDAAAA